MENLKIQRDWVEINLKNLEAQSLSSCPADSTPAPSNTSTPLNVSTANAPNGVANVIDAKFISDQTQSNNWVYGTTPEQFNVELFHYMTGNDVIKCPASTPFAVWDSNTCINCTEPTPIFNLKTHTCMGCPDSEVLDPTNHKCIVNNCTDGKVWNSATNQCSCPASKPYSDGNSCQQCLLPFFWYEPNLACSKCQDGYLYNAQLKVCEA